jgi:hypothetical protein
MHLLFCPALLVLVSCGGGGGGGTNEAPVARAVVFERQITPGAGQLQVPVVFDASSSTDPDGSVVQFEWTFDGDSARKLTLSGPLTEPVLFDRFGDHSALLRVTDNSGTSASATINFALDGIPGDPIFADADSDISIDQNDFAVIGARPAAAYGDPVSGELRFARAADAQGSNWEVNTVLALPTVSPHDLTLLEINGNPAISFIDFAHRLHYVRADDAQGSSWPAPVLVEDTTINGDVANATMVPFAGGPAIIYVQANTNLIFARPSDGNGTQWDDSTFTTISHGVSIDRLTAAVINGEPAVSYQGLGGDVFYSHLTDEISAAFSDPVNAFDPSDIDEELSLAEVADRPAISYGGNGGLFFCHAQDADGQNWGPLVNIFPTSEDVSDPVLFDLNGLPLIVFNNEIGASKSIDLLTLDEFASPPGVFSHTLLPGLNGFDLQLGFAADELVVAFRDRDNNHLQLIAPQ